MWVDILHVEIFPSHPIITLALVVLLIIMSAQGSGFPAITAAGKMCLCTAVYNLAAVLVADGRSERWSLYCPVVISSRPIGQLFHLQPRN